MLLFNYETNCCTVFLHYDRVSQFITVDMHNVRPFSDAHIKSFCTRCVELALIELINCVIMLFMNYLIMPEKKTRQITGEIICCTYWTLNLVWTLI